MARKLILPGLGILGLLLLSAQAIGSKVWQLYMLDHVIVFDERALRRILVSYFHYYHRPEPTCRWQKTHPSRAPFHHPKIGPIVAKREVGGLHHRYERQAA